MIRLIAAAFALAFAMPANAAVKLPDAMLGMWCLTAQTNNEYEFYERRECGPGKEDPVLKDTNWPNSYLIIGPDRLQAHEMDCRILRIAPPRQTRRGPMYQLTARCWDEGSVGIDHIKIWDLGDGLMLRGDNGSRYRKPE